MFNIPRPQRYRLDDPPLAQVLVQVRFPLVAHFQELSGIATLQDRLFDLFPYLEPQQAQVAFQIVVGSAVPVSTSPTTVWKFTNDDGWTLTVEPGAVALFTGREGYRGYEDFAAKFSRILEALVATNRIARCDRLGIRFINIAEPVPGQERAWLRWFKPELLGLTSTEVFGEHTLVASSLTQSQLSARPTGSLVNAPADVQALIRHGVLPPNSGIPLESGTIRELEQESYVLDIDLFVQATQRFDQAILLRQFAAIHAQIDAFFYWSLTDAGKQDFGLVEL